MKLCLAVTAFLFASAPLLSSAAKVVVYLLDENGKKLSHGEAIVEVYRVRDHAHSYAGFYRQQGLYSEEFPNTDIVDITIYYNQETRARTLTGLSGRQNHTLFVRMDHEGNWMPCAGGGVSVLTLEESRLLDSLDAMFPDGAPAQMSNVQTYLKRSVLKRLNELSPTQDPEVQQERQQARDRINKHLSN